MTKRNPKVLVIGAGMTGILAVIKLRKAGISDVVVLEKAADLGGTWRENRYPGVACDIPSHMYTYSFEPNPDWSEFFACGAEIQAYFQRVAEKYQVLPTIHFNEAVTSCQYHKGKWKVSSSRNIQYECDFVICATGILHHPHIPDIPGLDNFQGTVFHTARWNNNVKLAPDQSIGVIGTGSTAAQAIPELIDSGAQVKVFQRTPQWLLPLANFRFPDKLKAMARRSKRIQYWLRKLPFLFMEHVFTKAVIGRPLQSRLVAFICKLNLRLSIKDPILRKKLTPNYRVGCKRIVVNKTFYAAMQKSNAYLITEGIERITESGVVTKDGKLHKLDTLILSTGFDAKAFMRPMDVTGRSGQSIDNAWQNGIPSYRSILLPDFPNFFLMLGPFTPIGNFSVIAMSEVQLNYITQLIEGWQDRGFDSVEPTSKAVEDFYQHVKNGLKNTAWVSGCQSWYLDSNGNPILWPYTWQQWVKEMQQPQWHDLQQNHYPLSDVEPAS